MRLYTIRSRRPTPVVVTWLAMAVAVVLCVATGHAHAASPDTLRLATGSDGGTFLPVGHDLAAWWEQEIPGLVVIVDTTSGSVDNLDRLVSGEADLAIVGGSPFREVLGGWGTMADEAELICTLGTLYRDAEQFVVRKSFIRVGNLLDLNGLLMYPGPHNSGGEVDTRLILTTLGIEPQYVYREDRDKGYHDAAEALERGEFDAATFSGGVPIQAVTDLFKNHPGEFEILPFSRHMLRKLMHFENDFEGVVIPAGSYPGQENDVQAVGGPNLLVAKPKINPRLVARLLLAFERGIHTPGQGLRAESSHPVLQALTPELFHEIPVGDRCPGSGEITRVTPE